MAEAIEFPCRKSFTVYIDVIGVCLLMVILSVTNTFSQSVIKGKIIDSLNTQGIAFANLTLSDGRNGSTTDIEGTYTLSVPADYSGIITITHISYKSRRVSYLQLKSNPVVRLVPASTQLREITITGTKAENPAFRIIRQAIAHKKDNDPAYLSSYQYTSYNKFLVTMGPASKKMDSIVQALKNRPDTMKLKESQKNLLSFDSMLQHSHLFLSESVTEKQVVNPDKEKEKLIGLQVSGFKSPMFTSLANNYQPISFYQDNIFLLDKNYVNPVSRGTFGRYQFQLADTTYAGNDTIYIIHYQPKPKTFFNGLKGMLSITTDGWAIKNVIASSADSLAKVGIRVQQNYEKTDGHWFPAQLNTDLTLRQINFASRYMTIRQRSFLKDIKINPHLNRSQFGDLKIDLTMPKEKENNLVLNHFRNDSLDVKEKRTYTMMDSVMRKVRWLDHFLEMMVTQTVPMGPLDFDISRFLRINKYESRRLGVGLYTNGRFISWLRLGGYAGYGFLDKQWKYGGEVRFNFNTNKDFYLKFSYAKDIYETGSSHIIKEGQLLGADSYRSWAAYQYDRIEYQKAELGYLVRPNLHAQVFFSYNKIEPTYNYQLNFNGEMINHFTIAETGIALRYIRNESYLLLNGKKVFIGQQFPVITLSLAQAAPWLDALYFNYKRIDFSAKQLFTHRNGSKTRFFLAAGYIDGLAPYGKLYNGRGTRSISYLVDDYFQTMDLYEFTATQYASVFLNHNFGNVLLNKKFSKPELVLYHNAGIGRMDHALAHQGVPLQSFDKGYIESGVGLNNIVRGNYANVAYWGFGGAVFYRYGPYQLANPSANTFFRITFSFTF
ncbi:MAG: carboxypeptidase-like regulatory domain-containing protein [Bacteroidetes bacterium]|nr:carboxypeptidase-like regulatory domain-containing protein [Bacteroidota bacterium]MBS1541143.1 carboxypeptidase-like regulatory domain-containing protein [Bacteroidota bacterium]